jgi:putative ABC transport system permease protein
VTLVVALIGAVSLLVAGIGILNIMLVSVAERTREIGLRKAIGATRLQVLLQFFIEALALSTFGCLVGLALGVAIGALVNQFAIVHLSGIVAPIPWLRSIAIATGFATVVTLAFGTYPAWRAATLDPIEALRYE